jgi:hypothetical protein
MLDVVLRRLALRPDFLTLILRSGPTRSDERWNCNLIRMGSWLPRIALAIG